MEFKRMRGREATLCAAIGCVGALLFLFLFPLGSISTLMHDVLGLGPLVVLAAVISFLVTRPAGGGLIASLAFGLSCGLVLWLFRIPTNPKGAFGSLPFIAVLALAGVVAEGSMMLGRALKLPWRSVLTGAISNAMLLTLYWLLIFPSTAEWVKWGDVPPLLGLCLGCGAVSGYIAYAVSRAFSPRFAPQERE
ncbi:MAG: hypothetical protein AMS25_15015 [Gemmatimonas sp. SM23_52]|nr:MAG: hypothetical protein AMS25_15015 [Gemmatimonas sp. SM23_52]